MADKILTLGEEVHIFRRKDLTKFEHFIRSRWDKNQAREIKVNGEYTKQQVDDWLAVWRDPISFGHEMTALDELQQRLEEDPHHFPKKEPE